jgi:hypothetical protein
MPTTYNAKWRETTNLTIDDTTGKTEKTSGAAATFNASGRLGQMFDGLNTVVVEATIASLLKEMAIGIYAFTTTYTIGSVTVASLLACWHIDTAGNAIVKESGTTKFTQAGVALNDIVKIQLTAAGALTYYYNGVLKFTSLISAGTVQGWRPWRVMTTHADTNSKFDPVTITGESSEYFDRDSVASNVPMETIADGVEYTLTITAKVHTPDNQAGEAGPGSEQPFARAWVM